MKKLLIIALLASFSVISCTENQRAKNWGGTQTIEINSNEEFVNATWKGDNLWIITKNKQTGQIIIREKSSFGAMEGTIIFK